MTKSMPKNTDALSLADWIDSDFDPDEMLERGYDAIAAELRRLSKVEAAFKEWIEKTDWVQRTAKPAELGIHRADVLASRMAEIDKACIDAANRAAAAEQQVTALTQRLDMANQLNTDARNQLAQLSARQAAPEREPLSHEAARKLVWSASTWSRSEGVSEDDVLEVIAAVERAQGIGATND